MTHLPTTVRFVHKIAKSIFRDIDHMMIIDQYCDMTP